MHADTFTQFLRDRIGNENFLIYHLQSLLSAWIVGFLCQDMKKISLVSATAHKIKIRSSAISMIAPINTSKSNDYSKHRISTLPA